MPTFREGNGPKMPVPNRPEFHTSDANANVARLEKAYGPYVASRSKSRPSSRPSDRK